MAEVIVQEVVKRFGRQREVWALNHASTTIAPGEFFVLLGPSGCGKTTLLRCLAGLEYPDAGEIVVNDKVMFSSGEAVAVPSHKRDIGMVFQNYALWPHMTVEKNVGYPLRVAGVKRGDRAEAVMEVLKLVQCGELGNRLPSELSGGQQQRVALARSLIAGSTVILFDEPLSNVDAQLRRDLRADLREQHRNLGFTAVYVTHDQEEAMELATRIAVMGSGRILQEGTPEDVYHRPASPYIAEFLGIRNRVQIGFQGGQWQASTGSVLPVTPNTLESRKTYDVFLRSKDLVLAEPLTRGDNGRCSLGSGVVRDVLYGGERNEVILQVGAHRLQASVPSTVSANLDDQVEVGFSWPSALVYDEDGRLVANESS